MQCILVGTAAAKMIQYFIKKKKYISSTCTFGLKIGPATKLAPRDLSFVSKRNGTTLKKFPAASSEFVKDVIVCPLTMLIPLESLTGTKPVFENDI